MRKKERDSIDQILSPRLALYYSITGEMGMEKLCSLSMVTL